MTRLEELYNEMANRKMISTKKEFAEKFGFAYANLARYLTGQLKTTIDSENYRNFADMGINIDWLLTGEGEMFKQGKEAESAVAVSAPKIPILRQKVSCGPGQGWESEDNIESYIEPLSPLPCLSGRNVYAFRASGVSMIGLGIQDGDVVFFDGSSDQRTRDGIYVFGFAGDAYCKLLRFEPLENKVMVYSVQKPDLREAELVRTIDADSNEFHIFGRVLAWLHENTMFRT